MQSYLICAFIVHVSMTDHMFLFCKHMRVDRYQEEPSEHHIEQGPSYLLPPQLPLPLYELDIRHLDSPGRFSIMVRLFTKSQYN